ncbi:TetR/AcrR family transcriptional regulator [Stenotrophomonas sp. SY1]|uniref:TetR/AcrR family transcriptional regulator n=1 Tax=Stenotrophomonas sp. SY1 TaxID=477235 RepID=UPI001E5D500C|nr:TetR/AcrR family transcriptional regulator [Stenotrophomonas sp. SY1]MCD9086773.1 TetR/AcrR family transcriptional regulator [Stenotrophomonas sp. SY1]
MPIRNNPDSPDLDKPSLPPRPMVELQRRGELRVEKFLEAATEVFNEKGYQAARLSDIVKRAGGSMATLYRAFGDKEGLIHALMERSIHNFGQSLDELANSTLPPELALEQAAYRMVEEMLTPARIACHRVVFAEGMNQPELRDWFHAHGVQPMEELLSQYFTRETEAGRLYVEDPARAAHQFYMLVIGGVILRSVNGRMSPDDLPVAKENARSAVRLFLSGAMPRN